MKIIKKYTVTIETEIPENISNQLKREIEKYKNDTQFKNLKYHEQLEKVYSDKFGNLFDLDSNLDLVDWHIEI